VHSATRGRIIFHCGGKHDSGGEGEKKEGMGKRKGK